MGSRYGFQLCSEETKDIPTTDALIELKYDGERAHWDGTTGKLLNRHGNEVSRKFPEVVEKLPKGVVLDGEIIIYGPDGVSEFTMVLRRGERVEVNRLYAKVNPAHFIAFDVLEKDKVVLVDQPLIKRREILLSIPGIETPKWWAIGDADVAKQYIWDRGEEGLIYKRLGSLYRADRSMAWVKWKGWKHRALPIVKHAPTEKGGYTVTIFNGSREQEIAVGGTRDQAKLKAGEAVAILVRYLEEYPDGALRQGTNRGIYRSLIDAEAAKKWVS